jgi:hypothetical protein
MDLPGTALLMRSELLALAAGACESAMKASAVLLHAAAMQHSSTRLLLCRWGAIVLLPLLLLQCEQCVVLVIVRPFARHRRDDTFTDLGSCGNK